MTNNTTEHNFMFVRNFLFIVFTLSCIGVSAQKLSSEEIADAKQKAQSRAEYSMFRRQIMTLKEFADERQKAAALKKEQHQPVKVIATVDSTDGSGEEKTLTGFITRVTGSDQTNIYEVTFDRKTRHIIALKPTGEGGESAANGNTRYLEELPSRNKQPGTKQTKKKGSDDDEEEDEEKTPSPKDKDDE